MSKQIPVGESFTIVDDADFDCLSQFTWRADPQGRTIYARCNGGEHRGKYIHQILLMVREVDHINGNGLDNRRENLRESTHSQNCMNAVKRKLNIGVPTTSKYKGVSWHRGKNKWFARIDVQSKQTFLGQFSDERKAAESYDTAARKLHGEFARLNFPGKGERQA